MAAATERARQDRRVDAAGLRPDADPGRLPGLLEDDRDLGLLGLGQEVDDALRVGGDRAGRDEVGVEQAGVDDPPARLGRSSRSRTRAEEPQLGSGLER